MNPYDMNPNSYSQPTLNCQLCNTVFQSKIATPFMTQCGHFYCQQRCENTLTLVKKCLVIGCQKVLDPKLFKRNQTVVQNSKLNSSKFSNKGNNVYLMSVLHPEKIVCLKHQCSGSMKFKDFIKKFPMIDSYLSQNGADNFNLVITNKTAFYKDVKDKTFDQLKQAFSLVTINDNNGRVNPILFVQRDKGGLSQMKQQLVNFEITH